MIKLSWGIEVKTWKDFIYSLYLEYVLRLRVNQARNLGQQVIIPGLWYDWWSCLDVSLTDY